MPRRRSARKTAKNRKGGAGGDAFRDRLRCLVHEFKSQQEFADAVRTTGSSVTAWLNGTSLPGSKHLTRIAEQTGVSLDWLMMGEGGDQPVYRKVSRPAGSLGDDLAQEMRRRVLARLARGEFEGLTSLIGTRAGESRVWKSRVRNYLEVEWAIDATTLLCQAERAAVALARTDCMIHVSDLELTRTYSKAMKTLRHVASSSTRDRRRGVLTAAHAVHALAKTARAIADDARRLRFSKEWAQRDSLDRDKAQWHRQLKELRQREER